MSTNTQRKHNPVESMANHIMISNEQHFAVLEKRPNSTGLQGVTFSFDITQSDAGIINKSGIARVEVFGASGIIAFTRKSFYENSKMVEIIIDILKRYENK